MRQNLDYYSYFSDYNIDEYYKKFLIDNSQEMSRFQTIISFIPKDCSSILDVGCGNGLFLHLTQKSNNMTHQVGIEPIKIKIPYMVNNFNIPGVIADAAHIPFKNDSFDVVTALEVLEHLPYNTYLKALSEIQRIAKKYIIISVPYNEKLYNIKCPYCNCEFNPNYHIRSFNEKNLKTIFSSYQNILLEKIGIKQISAINLKKIHLKDSFPEFAVCPLCGYRKMNDEDKIKKDFFIKIPYLYKIIPKKTSYRWIVGIYKKC
ncbi:MAG TPA: class I SAM-dependent methyltransferase [Methanolinea sp.]|nr:class I SAM-dependent methyltransferase [Methanolinea sp.]